MFSLSSPFFFFSPLPSPASSLTEDGFALPLCPGLANSIRSDQTSSALLWEILPAAARFRTDSRRLIVRLSAQAGPEVVRLGGGWTTCLENAAEPSWLF